jgi:Flp pilus assembly CpaF family ATPase
MSKYRNVRTEVDGITFDSKKEARRYGELTTLLADGEISRLMLQPKFDIIVNGIKVAYYKADFAYFNKAGDRVIEDVKGMKTPMYRLKKKLVEALHGVKIVET